MTIVLIFILNFKTLLNKEIEKSYIKFNLGINYLKIENKLFSNKFSFKRSNEILNFSFSSKNFRIEYNFNKGFYTKFKFKNNINKIELKSKNFSSLDFNSFIDFENMKIKILKYNLQINLFKKFNNFKVISSLKYPYPFNKKIKILNKLYYLTDRYKILLSLSDLNRFAFNTNLRINSFKFSISNILKNKEGAFSIISNFNLLFSYKIQNLKLYLHISKTLYLSLRATF